MYDALADGRCNGGCEGLKKEKIQERNEKEKEKYVVRGTKKSSRNDDGRNELQHTKDEWVVLNVGGKRYETFKSTLTKYPDTMLAKMFSGDFTVVQNEKKEYLIDRSGKPFVAVLDFLRTGRFSLPPGVSEKQLEIEFDYFGLPLKGTDAFYHKTSLSSKRMADMLVLKYWEEPARDLYNASKNEIYKSLEKATQSGSFVSTIYLIPQNWAENIYADFHGQQIGTVVHKSDTLLYLLVPENFALHGVNLFASYFREEGFKVEKDNQREPPFLRFIKLYWDEVSLGDTDMPRYQMSKSAYEDAVHSLSENVERFFFSSTRGNLN